MKSLKPLLTTDVGSRLSTGLLVYFLVVLTMLPAAPALAAGSGSWTLTGNFHVARAYFIATLLPNGQVLVAGGNSAGPTASAELYTP